jgi:hypothetical protein
MKFADVLPTLILAILYFAAYWWPTVGLVTGWVLLAMGLIVLWAGGGSGGEEGKG